MQTLNNDQSMHALKLSANFALMPYQTTLFECSVHKMTPLFSILTCAEEAAIFLKICSFLSYS